MEKRVKFLAAMTRGRAVAERPEHSDAWERRDGMIIHVGTEHSETHAQTSLNRTRLM